MVMQPHVRFAKRSNASFVSQTAGRTKIGNEPKQADLEVEDGEEHDAVELLRHLVQQRRARLGSCLGSCRLAALHAHPPHRQLSQLLVPVVRTEAQDEFVPSKNCHSPWLHMVHPRVPKVKQCCCEDQF